ncbi:MULTISPECIES: hypothetical protein [unclassified Microbacterium]|uniref:hypothetical protein n=1 Tax=unclassified Microbacterium TaxID=2609290 RepID=UPI001AC780F0|nr:MULTISPECIES: hypothetical protein [unclassified Microbacterium]MBN9223945.1 hypothetical protein [Microbacterium sp.]
MLTRIRRTFRRVILGKPISHEEQRAARAGMYRDQRVVQQQAARQVGAGAPLF